MLAAALAVAAFTAPSSAAPAAGGTGGPMAGKPPVAAAAKKPAVAWTDHFYNAQRRAQKEEKPMLLYFCGSDWDDWTMKLDEEVLNTPLWAEWANKELVLLKVDYPRNDKKQRAETRNQAAELKTRFNIAKVPTFIFLDPWGDLLARVGYSAASLKEDEAKDQPKRWLDYCKQVVASRPIKERLVGHPDVTTAVAAVRKTAIPLCILITQPKNQVAATRKETLLTNQLFVRFINRNMGFVHVEWPEETDKSPKANAVRDFAAKWKFGAMSAGMVIWDPGGLGQTKLLIGDFGDGVDCGPLVKRLEPLLPTIDYNGGWIEDWKAARAVAAQQQKDLLVSFVSTDASEYTKRMYAEIYDRDEFKEYAKKNLVLLKVDFPEAEAAKAKQGKALAEQNNMLADMFGVKGYPTVVVLNPKGQKIVDAKYMKGGAVAFVGEMKKQIAKDRDRRTLISQEAAKEVEKGR